MSIFRRRNKSVEFLRGALTFILVLLWAFSPMLSTLKVPFSNEKIKLGFEVKKAEASFDNGYTYRRTITIQNGQVIGSANFTGFPVLVSFTEPEFRHTDSSGHVTDLGGDDIVFASDTQGASPLKHEVERYTSTTGEVIMWVEVPTLDFDNDTVIYMFYGKSSVTSPTEDVSGTWDNTTDGTFVGVWHMDDSGSTNSDSAGTAQDGSVSGATAGANVGKFGPAFTFDGVNDVSTVTDHADLDIQNTGTIEAWVQTTSTSSKPTTNMSSWVSRTAPSAGVGAGEYSQLDSVIVGERIYYGNVNCTATTDAFSTASSTLSGSSVTAWAVGTSPTGACATDDGSSIGVDSDGQYIWYAVLNNAAATEAFSYATSTLSGRFSAWISPASPAGAGAGESSSIDVVITGKRAYFYALMLNGNAEADAVASINLDGSDWSGWIDPSGTIPAGTGNEGCGVGLDTNGDRLYLGGMCGVTTAHGRMDMNLGLSSFDAWIASAAPTSAGASEHAFNDIAIVGDYMYHALFAFTTTAEAYQYASSTLDLATPALAWINLGTGQPNGTATTNSADAALESDGKNLFYSAFAHSADNTAIWTTASSTLPAHPFVSKLAAYEMIQTGSGYVFDWAGKPTTFGTSTAPDTFKHVAVTHTGSIMNYYVDGVRVASSTVSTDFESNANNLLLGEGFNAFGTGIFFGGVIDEVRVSSTARSYDWIQTEYNNQNATSTFYNLSAEEENIITPTVTTNFATPGFNSANLNGTKTGGSNATEHGFAYGTDSTLASAATTTLGALTTNSSFSSGIASLSANTTYFFRAYAFVGALEGYGTIRSFVTGNSTAARTMRLFEGSTIKFINGKVVLHGSGSSGGGGPGDTGLKSPTATGEDHNQWGTPTQAFSSDGLYASETVLDEKQDYYTFTFNVPAGATINGIEVKAEARDIASPGSCTCTMGVELSWDGGPTYTTSGFDTGELTTTYTVYTLGGATDTWGRTWADTEFADGSFRLRVNADVISGATPSMRLDHVQVKVYYTQ